MADSVFDAPLGGGMGSMDKATLKKELFEYLFSMLDRAIFELYTLCEYESDFARMDDACEALQNGLSEFAGLRARIAVILGQPIPDSGTSGTPVRHATGASAKASRKGVAWEVKRVSHFAPHRSHPSAAQAAIKAMLERMAEQRANAPAGDGTLESPDAEGASGTSAVQAALLEEAPAHSRTEVSSSAPGSGSAAQAASAQESAADGMRTPPSRSRSPSPERPAVFARGSGIALSPVGVMASRGAGEGGGGPGVTGTPSGSGTMHSARGTPGRADRPSERDSHTTPVRSSSARPSGGGGMGTPPRPGSVHHGQTQAQQHTQSPGEQPAMHAPSSAHKGTSADESGNASNANATRASTAVLLMHEFDRLHTAKWGDIMMDETDETWLASAAASPERPTPLQRSLESARSAEVGTSGFSAGTGAAVGTGHGNAWGQVGGRKAPMRAAEDLQHSPGASSPSAPSSSLKNKLSSPARHRSTPDAVAAKAEERQAKAEANRGRIQEEKRHKLREASQRQAEVSAWQQAVRVEKSVSLASKLSAAEERHEGMLRAKAAKAGSEVLKAQEVRHMGILEVENKRRAIEVSQEQAAKRRAETLAKRASGGNPPPAHAAGPGAGSPTGQLLSAEALLAKQRAAGFSYASAAAGISRDSTATQHTPASEDEGDKGSRVASLPPSAPTTPALSGAAAGEVQEMAPLQPAAVAGVSSAAVPAAMPAQPPTVIVARPAKVAPWAAASSAGGTSSKSIAQGVHVSSADASTAEPDAHVTGPNQPTSTAPEPSSAHGGGASSAVRVWSSDTSATSAPAPKHRVHADGKRKAAPKPAEQAEDVDGFATVGAKKSREREKERPAKRERVQPVPADKGSQFKDGKAKEAKDAAAPVVTTRAAIPSAPAQPAWKTGSKIPGLAAPSTATVVSQSTPAQDAAASSKQPVKENSAHATEAAVKPRSTEAKKEQQRGPSTAKTSAQTQAHATSGGEEGWTQIGAAPSAPVPPPQRKSKASTGLHRAAGATLGAVSAGAASDPSVAAPLVPKADNAVAKSEKQAAAASAAATSKPDHASKVTAVPVAAAPVAPWASSRVTPSRPPASAAAAAGAQGGSTRDAKENSKPTGAQTVSPLRADTPSSSPASTVVSLLAATGSALPPLAQADIGSRHVQAGSSSPVRGSQAEKAKAKPVDDLDEDALLEKLAQENAAKTAAEAAAKSAGASSGASTAGAKVSAARKKKLKQKKAIAHNAATLYAAALRAAGIEVGLDLSPSKAGGAADASWQPLLKACAALVKACPVEDLPPALHANSALTDKDEPLEEGELVDAGIPTVRTPGLGPTVSLQVQGAAMHEVDRHVWAVWKVVEGSGVFNAQQNAALLAHQVQGKRVTSKTPVAPVSAVPDPCYNHWMTLQQVRTSEADTGAAAQLVLPAGHVSAAAMDVLRTSGVLSSACRCLSREMLTNSASTVSHAIRLIALASFTADGRQHLLTRGASTGIVDILTLCSADILTALARNGGVGGSAGRGNGLPESSLTSFPQHLPPGASVADTPEQHLHAIFINSCVALFSLLRVTVPAGAANAAGVQAALAAAQAGTISYALAVGVPQGLMGVVRAIRGLNITEQLSMGSCVSSVALILSAIAARPLLDGAVYGLPEPVDTGVYPAYRLLGVAGNVSCVPSCTYTESLLASLAEGKWTDLAPLASAWLVAVERQAEGVSLTNTARGRAQLKTAIAACSAAMQLANAVARLDIRGLRRWMLVDPSAPVSSQEVSLHGRHWLNCLDVFAKYTTGVLAMEGEDPAAAARLRPMIAVVEPLFGELCLAMDYAALSCPAVVSALGKPLVEGRGSSLLEAVATLPNKYYSNPVLRGLVLPTLMILSGSSSPENREVLLKHVAPSVFAPYLQEQEKGAATGVQPHFKLLARVPRSQWQPMMEAISGSLLSGEVS